MNYYSYLLEEISKLCPSLTTPSFPGDLGGPHLRPPFLLMRVPLTQNRKNAPSYSFVHQLGQLSFDGTLQGLSLHF